MKCETKDIINQKSAHSMIEEYQSVVSEVQKAFELLKSAKNRMKWAFGPYHDSILPPNVRDYNLDRELNSALDMILRNAWKGIVKKTNIKKMISTGRKRQLDEQLDRGKLPELNQKALADIGLNLDMYFKEAVQEVFVWLRPPGSKLKTNTECEIGKKVIIKSAVGDRYSDDVDYRFSCLDNVFHLLDGQGISKPPNDAMTLIQAAILDDGCRCETPYFQFRWFNNGNMHIWFKRLDLVKELNRIGGGNRIRPQ